MRTESAATLRATLEEERGHLRSQLADLAGSMSFDENFADSGQVAAEQGENRVMVNQIQETLSEVEHALSKLGEGSYGRCEGCDQEISEARLEAMPATRFCIACASSR